MKTDYLDRPCIEHSYKNRPSWKRYGDGTAIVKLVLEHDGSLEIKAAEWPEGIRGGKQVMVSLPPEKVAELRAMLVPTEK